MTSEGSANSNDFKFEISLSILNHLGRQLYRSFITVLGEAISNSWDANADNVYVYISDDGSRIVVKDDGDGMDADDFQHKFLKIGYSKRRKDGEKAETVFDSGGEKKRPLIGRKGIGKLALLSCAEEVKVLSKKEDTEYIGGVISNKKLDEAIDVNATADEYPLEKPNLEDFAPYTSDHEKGTIVILDKLNKGLARSEEYLKKSAALSFKFSLIDEGFTIRFNDSPLTIGSLKALIDNTQFLWTINGYEDDFVNAIKNCGGVDGTELDEVINKEFSMDGVTGFIASVKKPRNLTIFGSGGEKVGVDLFVNGRLREKDILKHSPSARVPESYLYGQIHYNDLDDAIDRFVSSREGVLEGDLKFDKFFRRLRTEIISPIIESWDELRRKYRDDGDSENKSLTPASRKAHELFNAASKEYKSPKEKGKKRKREKVDVWVEGLEDDASFNFEAYADCFIAENILRHYINENVSLSDSSKNQASDWIRKEQDTKANGGVSIEIRSKQKGWDSDLYYLEMGCLAAEVDIHNGIDRGAPNSFNAYGKQFKPLRNALMHTSLLTAEAKGMLRSIKDNIKGKIAELLGT